MRNENNNLKGTKMKNRMSIQIKDAAYYGKEFGFDTMQIQHEGCLRTVIDYALDFSSIDLMHETIQSTPETCVWIR